MGGAGLTANVLDEIGQALDAHELIKVKILADNRAERKALVETICRDCDATLVQAMGHVALIFRRSRIEKKRTIALP